MDLTKRVQSTVAWDHVALFLHTICISYLVGTDLGFLEMTVVGARTISWCFIYLSCVSTFCRAR